MFPGGKKGMKDLMKQAQKMQQDMLKAQEDLKTKTVEATAGGGMVNVVMNGEYKVQSLKIDPEAIDPDDVEMLEDLIIAAMNEARDKVANNSEDEMTKLTGGLKIPGLF